MRVEAAFGRRSTDGYHRTVRYPTLQSVASQGGRPPWYRSGRSSISPMAMCSSAAICPPLMTRRSPARWSRKLARSPDGQWMISEDVSAEQRLWRLQAPSPQTLRSHDAGELPAAPVTLDALQPGYPGRVRYSRASAHNNSLPVAPCLGTASVSRTADNAAACNSWIPTAARSGNAAIGDGSTASTGQYLCGEVPAS